MNQRCAFTICAKNYLGLAQTLENSLRVNNPDTDFLIVIADDFDGQRPLDLPANVLMAKTLCDISSSDWRDMSFKYQIVEFCTSIKPFCIRYLLKQGYDVVLYFDPDVLIFAPLTEVLEALQHSVVVLTPHRIDIDNNIRHLTGIYNLGFIGVRQSVPVHRMLSWWESRLRNGASADIDRGLFMDQKWMDYLPVVLGHGELFISRHPGLNYAPWNFAERKAVKRGGRFFVRLKNAEIGGEYPLVFFHYSGFKYRDISLGCFDHPYIRMSDREPELYDLIRSYGDKIAEYDFLTYLDLPYSYDRFSDGTQIQYNHRQIYKRLCDEGYRFTYPADANGAFFDLLKRRGVVERSTAEVGADQPARARGADMNRRVRIIDALISMLIWTIGFSRYTRLARFMIRYLHLGNQARFLGAEFRKLEIK